MDESKLEFYLKKIEENIEKQLSIIQRLEENID